MCELSVYILEDGEETILMEEVASIKPEGDRWVLTDLLGQP